MSKSIERRECWAFQVVQAAMRDLELGQFLLHCDLVGEKTSIVGEEKTASFHFSAFSDTGKNVDGEVTVTFETKGHWWILQRATLRTYSTYRRHHLYYRYFLSAKRLSLVNIMSSGRDKGDCPRTFFWTVPIPLTKKDLRIGYARSTGFSFFLA